MQRMETYPDVSSSGLSVSKAGTSWTVCRCDSLVCSNGCFTQCAFEFGLQNDEERSLVFSVEKSRAISMSSFWLRTYAIFSLQKKLMGQGELYCNKYTLESFLPRNFNDTKPFVMRGKAILQLKYAAWTGGFCLWEVPCGICILWEQEVASLSSGKSQWFLFFTKSGQVNAIISLIFLNRESYFQNIGAAINLGPVESFGGTGWRLVNFCWCLADEIVGRKQQNRSSQYRKAWLLTYIVPWATKNTLYLCFISDRQLSACEMWIKHEVGKLEEWFPKAILFLLSCVLGWHGVELSKARSLDLHCLFTFKLHSSEGGYFCI